MKRSIHAGNDTRIGSRLGVFEAGASQHQAGDGRLSSTGTNTDGRGAAGNAVRQGCGEWHGTHNARLAQKAKTRGAFGGRSIFLKRTNCLPSNWNARAEKTTSILSRLSLRHFPGSFLTRQSCAQKILRRRMLLSILKCVRGTFEDAHERATAKKIPVAYALSLPMPFPTRKCLEAPRPCLAGWWRVSGRLQSITEALRAVAHHGGRSLASQTGPDTWTPRPPAAPSR